MTTNGRPRIYISGPITGVSDPFPAFARVSQIYRKKGYRVLNPGRLGRTDPDWAFRRALRMLLRSDEVAVLVGWEKSKGARLEVRIAFDLGLPVVESWTGNAVERTEGL